MKQAVFLALAGICAGLTWGCRQTPSRFQTAYAEIVAEEDARGAIGMARVYAYTRHVDPAIRAMAVRAMGRLEDPVQLPRIQGLLDDPSPVVRAAAASAMAQAVFGQDPLDVPQTLAARAGGEDDPGVLGILAANLGRLGWRGDEQHQAIIRGLANAAKAVGDDPELTGRLGVARGIAAIARSGDETAASDNDLRAVAKSLTDVVEAEPVRTAARIRRLAVSARGRWGQMGLAEAESLAGDPDWGVRREVLVAAAGLGDGARQVIAKGLADADPRVRVEALRAYDRTTRASDGCGPLYEALNDPDPHVVLTAMTLAAQPCPDQERQTEALAERVAGTGDPPEDWHASARALYALAAINPVAASSYIERFKVHPSPFARTWAARAAAAAGDATTLKQLASDPAANVREASLRGLAAVAAAEAHPFLVAELKANDPQLVMTAALLLRDTDNPADARMELLAALDRFTARARETTRDARVALLETLAEAGEVPPGRLAPYLRDFDPS